MYLTLVLVPLLLSYYKKIKVKLYSISYINKSAIKIKRRIQFYI